MKPQQKTKYPTKMELSDGMEASKSPYDRQWRVWFMHPILHRWVIGGVAQKLRPAHVEAKEARNKARAQARKLREKRKAEMAPTKTEEVAKVFKSEQEAA